MRPPIGSDPADPAFDIVPRFMIGLTSRADARRRDDKTADRWIGIDPVGLRPEQRSAHGAGRPTRDREQESMRRIRITGLALAAVFATSAVATPTAFAKSENNPQWQVCEKHTGSGTKYTDSACSKPSTTGEYEDKILGEGESRGIEAEANGAQKLHVSGSPAATIKCTALKLKPEAKILGGQLFNEATDEETIVFEKCEVEGYSGCKINNEAPGSAKITTSLLLSWLDFETKKAAEYEEAPTITRFAPMNSEGPFATVELNGSCPWTGKFEIRGEVAVKNLNGAVCLGTHELEAPEPPIKEYWRNEGMASVRWELNALKFGASSASYVGKIKVKLENKQDWDVFN